MVKLTVSNIPNESARYSHQDLQNTLKCNVIYTAKISVHGADPINVLLINMLRANYPDALGVRVTHKIMFTLDQSGEYITAVASDTVFSDVQEVRIKHIVLENLKPVYITPAG